MTHALVFALGLAIGLAILWLDRRDRSGQLALERARQDLLLDRLGSRTPAEYHGLRSVHVGDVPSVNPYLSGGTPGLYDAGARHLYDSTGLIHEVYPAENVVD